MNKKDINYTPEQNKYKKLTPFKAWCLTNFPFIEEDFDSLTNYGYMSKIGGYLNEIMYNQNLVEQDVTNMFNAYTQLENYVNTYFSNLDINTEINDKLDELVEDGTLNNMLRTLIEQNYGRNNLSVHLSIDDVDQVWKHLTSQNYQSIFDEPLLKYLRQLHETYNINISLYVFTDSFNLMPNNYSSEFIANSDWLKIGYHGLNGSDNLNGVSYTQAYNRYSSFVTNCLRICGTNKIIDRFPRLANYVGDSYCINAFSQCPSGIIGLLDADDTRISYDHTTYDIDYLSKNYELFSPLSYLFYVKTNMRLENIDDINNALNQLFNTSNGTARNIEIFTHENNIISNGQVIPLMNTKLLACCEYFKNNNIPYDFLQNKYPNLSSGIISSNQVKVQWRINGNIQGINTMGLYDVSIGNLVLGVKPDSYSTNIDYTGNLIYLALNGILRVKSDNKLHIYTNKVNMQFTICELVDSHNRAVNQTPNGEHFNIWHNITPNQVNEYKLTEGTKFIEVICKNNDGEQFTPEDVLNNTIIFY